MYKKSTKKEITKRSYAFKAAYSQLNTASKAELRRLMKRLFGLEENAFRYRMRGEILLKVNEADVVKDFFASKGIGYLYDYEIDKTRN